jgi:hypothetical protein
LRRTRWRAEELFRLLIHYTLILRVSPACLPLTLANAGPSSKQVVRDVEDIWNHIGLRVDETLVELIGHHAFQGDMAASQ